jgi:hypothetical protein
MTLLPLIKHGFIIFIFTKLSTYQVLKYIPSQFGVLVKLPYYLSMIIGDFKGCMSAVISNFSNFHHSSNEFYLLLMNIFLVHVKGIDLKTHLPSYLD